MVSTEKQIHNNIAAKAKHRKGLLQRSNAVISKAKQYLKTLGEKAKQHSVSNLTILSEQINYQITEDLQCCKQRFDFSYHLAIIGLSIFLLVLGIFAFIAILAVPTLETIGEGFVLLVSMGISCTISIGIAFPITASAGLVTSVPDWFRHWRLNHYTDDLVDKLSQSTQCDLSEFRQSLFELVDCATPTEYGSLVILPTMADIQIVTNKILTHIAFIESDLYEARDSARQIVTSLNDTMNYNALQSTFKPTTAQLLTQINSQISNCETKLESLIEQSSTISLPALSDSEAEEHTDTDDVYMLSKDASADEELPYAKP